MTNGGGGRVVGDRGTRDVDTIAIGGQLTHRERGETHRRTVQNHIRGTVDTRARAHLLLIAGTLGRMTHESQRLILLRRTCSIESVAHLLFVAGTQRHVTHGTRERENVCGTCETVARAVLGRIATSRARVTDLGVGRVNTTGTGGRRSSAIQLDIAGSGGVVANNITLKGYGGSYPVASNDAAEGRALNRRVVITISNIPSPPPVV